MTVTRRTVIGSAAIAALSGRSVRALGGGGSPTIRIGVLADMTGTYRDVAGPTTAVCVRQAVQEFTAGRDMSVEVLDADHQNKPDVAVTIARQWFDQDGVDMITDLGTSSVALAVANLSREKNKVALVSSAATSALTGAQCTSNSIHWTYDTWMLAKSTATNTLKAGGDTWFLIVPNYTFGHQLAHDTTEFITGAGGKMLGSAVYPFPETTDFSAFMLQAQASGAKVLGLCNAGNDTVNCVKQMREVGLQKTMQLAAMLIFINDIHALGADAAQGLHLTESFYWDLNEGTRAFTGRVRPKTPRNWPNMSHAGDYSATLHYLKAVADMGVTPAKADGRAVVARMKAMPTEDDCFGKGYIREDGRKIHPSYLFEVKSPADSRHQWDLYKLVATTPAGEAFRPLREGGCPLAHA